MAATRGQYCRTRRRDQARRWLEIQEDLGPDPRGQRRGRRSGPLRPACVLWARGPPFSLLSGACALPRGRRRRRGRQTPHVIRRICRAATHSR
eukprot:2736246-Pyramimonas_sp.AAC.1